MSLRELPLDVIIPARLVVTGASGQAVLQQIEKPQRPTQAMRELFGKLPDGIPQTAPTKSGV